LRVQRDQVGLVLVDALVRGLPVRLRTLHRSPGGKGLISVVEHIDEDCE
jgi:hypothetical protein